MLLKVISSKMRKWRLWYPDINDHLTLDKCIRPCTRNLKCIISLNLGTTQRGEYYNLILQLRKLRLRQVKALVWDSFLVGGGARIWPQAFLYPHFQASLKTQPMVISVHWKWLLGPFKYNPTSNTTLPSYPQPGSNRKQCEVIITYTPATSSGFLWLNCQITPSQLFRECADTFSDSS